MDQELDTPRYIRWDLDRNVATEFERIGDCNGCGACCKALIRFSVVNSKNADDHDPRDLGDCVDDQGVWAEILVNDTRRLFKVTEINHNPAEKPCSKLGENNKCMVHFDKPRICSVWPVIPEQVTPFPECSYSFIQINEWAIGGEKQSVED